MPREDAQLSGAKRAYRNAKEEGNHQEEARWANVIGDIYKNRGEYVNALKWLRVDYEVSVKYLPERHVITTCQSLGEVYLRLHEFKEALVYQKKHLELAEDSNDLIEKQRANTQLGRTYHEMFSKSEDDHSSVRNAKKYFRKAMQLAQILKENPPSNNSSLLKEYIDAHNNIGMLEMDLDNLGEAKKFLTKGLEICDEEEVSENDDGRSRLNHNLGYVYMELRMWEEASEHIEKDIIICKNIGHCQGEAKGYINLGELHYRVQKYEEAIKCYRKALDLAKSMEDEDALADQINQNINTVNKAMQVMDDLKKEEQNLKKLNRKVVISSGKSGERKCLLLLNASLDRLIEKASIIMAWQKHRGYSKKKKTVASQLCDREKLGDSYVNIGESYEKLRMFDKALKWYTKSWEIYKSVGNLEGQAMAKINIGNILDSDGHWARAFNAFEEGHRIAAQAKLPHVQLMALENMHYSQMIRFDKIEEARRLQLEIDFLKSKGEYGMQDRVADHCSESDTEEEDNISLNRSSAYSSPRLSNFNSKNSKDFPSVEELNDDVPLISLIRPSKNKPKLKASQDNEPSISTKSTKKSPNAMSKLTSTQQTVVSRKRNRLVLSDDEEEVCDLNCSKGRLHEISVEDVATSDECAVKESPDAVLTAKGFKDVSGITSKCAISSTPVTLEESTCSYKSRSPRVVSQNEKDFISSSTNEVAFDQNMVTNCDVGASSYFKSPISADEYGQLVTFKIDNDLIHVDAGSCMVSDSLSIDSLKVEVACLYYLRLPTEKRSSGLLPIIRHMKYGGRPLQSLEATETLKNIGQKEWIEVTIDGWVQKRLMKLYVDCCKELSEAPNLKLLKKLYNLEVSEDEVIVSDCDLQDVSIVPLLNALLAHKTIAMLDLSHNLLGNGTMEKLQQVLISSSQKYGGFTLDLHCNRFGPTALFQICESPVLFARLEVLNISGNRLTDACGSYLKTIFENCKALYNLNVERCSITSRTIQKIADSLNAESALSQLSLGYNNPVSGNAIVNLATKLAMLKRFSELNLNGIKLSKPAVDSLCQLAHASCLSGLMVGGSSIGTDGALKLTESLFKGAPELVKLDLSYCGLTSPYIVKINTDFSLVSGILELNLGGNPLMKEGGSALALAMKNPQCSLKVLVLNKCQLGLFAVVQILQALAENNSLEELNLADNVDFDKDHTLVCDLPININISNTSPNECPPTEDEDIIENVCSLNNDELEVADSEDEQIREPAMSRFDGSCVSSSRMKSALTNCHFTRDLSSAIDSVKELKVLDLSGNGFSVQVAERLFSAWSLSSSRAAVAEKHIKDPIIHFSVQGVQCCGLKPCCNRD